MSQYLALFIVSFSWSEVEGPVGISSNAVRVCVFISLCILKTVNSHQCLHFKTQTTVLILVICLSVFVTPISDNDTSSSIMRNLLVWSIS